MYVFLTHDKIRLVAPLSNRGQHMLKTAYSDKIYIILHCVIICIILLLIPKYFVKNLTI